jgi:hypothetical protein
VLTNRIVDSDELVTKRVEPRTYNQAVESPEHEKWAEAIQKEVDSLHRNRTFTIMRRPRGAPVIGLKWVFKIKENKDGSIERYKARCCALGNL